MTNKRCDSGPAFPTYESIEFDSGAHSLDQQHRGMSRRDYFAAKAMAAMIATGVIGHITGDPVTGGLGQSNEAAEEFIGLAACRLADATLAALDE